MNAAEGGGSGPIPHEALSILLGRLAEGDDDAPIRVGDLLTGFAHRAYGLLFFLFAVPNLTPGPSLPGFSTLFGVPLMVVAAQLAIGRGRPWLPAWVSGRAVKRGRLRGILARILPLVVTFERVLQPRLRFLIDHGGERLVGAGVTGLAFVLALPIPVFSMLPATGIMVVGLGLLAGDGLAVALGLGAGIVSVGVLVGLVWAVLEALGWI